MATTVWVRVTEADSTVRTLNTRLSLPGLPGLSKLKLDLPGLL